jgi:hypothetical protein
MIAGVVPLKTGQVFEKELRPCPPRVSPPSGCALRSTRCSPPALTYPCTGAGRPARCPAVAAGRDRDRGDRVLGSRPVCPRCATEEARPGMRNGDCDTTIKATAGPVTLRRPSSRDYREVRLLVMRHRDYQDSCPGGARDRGVRPRPVGARCGGRARRGVGPGGRWASPRCRGCAPRSGSSSRAGSSAGSTT